MNRNLAAKDINERWKSLGQDEFKVVLPVIMGWMPPYEALRLAYDQGFAEPDVLPEIRAFIARHFSQKAQFLRFIYGEDVQLCDLTQWQNIRRPSAEKRLLVRSICNAVRQPSASHPLKPRWNWITPKVLHAFAFKQRFFEEHPFHLWNGDRGLYEIRRIPKGNGKTRTLWVPIAPLKRVQRALLIHCLADAQSSLPHEVLGGRPKCQDTRVGIFVNAAAHLGQAFVSSFDIANFFPSIRVDEVISTLQSLKTIMAHRLHPQPTLAFWTHDAAVLVGRLVTYRGRLPQGAPTSPAIANLVFAKFDNAISEKLGRDFVYTRYFDDLTISISNAAAKKLRINSPQQLQCHAQRVIDEVLAKSGFRLNHRKSRTTSLADGHRVTGLAVSHDQVNLPRKARRNLSALMHQIDRDGLVRTAAKHIDGSVFSRVHFDSGRKEHFEDGRSQSLEFQAAAMISQLCPQLALEIPGETWALAGQRIVKETELHEGAQAVHDVRRLLSSAWRGELSVVEEDSHFVFNAAARKTVARLRCGSNGDFFLLSKRQAVATIKLWHHLRGWYAGLKPGYHDECFGRLQQFRNRIKETLDNALMKAQKLPTPSVAPEIGLRDLSLLRHTGEVKETAGDVWNLYAEFVDKAGFGAALQSKANQYSADFHAPVVSMKDFRVWLQRCNSLFTEVLPVLPLREELLSPGTLCVVPVLRLFDDLLEGRRTSQYKSEGSFLGKHLRKRRIGELDDADAASVQKAILDELKRLLSENLKEYDSGQTDWKQSLASNPWDNDQTEQLKASFRLFVKLHSNAVWNTTAEPVFQETSHIEVAKNPQEFFNPIESSTRPDEVRDKLFAFAKRIVKCTTDSLNGDLQTYGPVAIESLEKKEVKLDKKTAKKYLHEELSIEVGKESAEFFQIVFAMRNRDAHPEEEGQIGDWNRTQAFIAKLLGKNWNPGKGEREKGRLYHPQDLKLTAFEGTEVKIAILRGICIGLERLQPKS